MTERRATEAEALDKGAGLAQLAGRCQIELRGGDRASFLNGLTTNQVKTLVAGTGCETFLCNSHGKTIGHGYIFCTPESLILDTAPSQAAGLMLHLDRYLIREQVQLFDRSGDWAELVLAGAAAPRLLEQLGCDVVPSTRMANGSATFAGAAVDIRRVDYLAGDCFFLSVPVSHADALATALLAVGAIRVSDESLEAARIEAGTPVFGIDITPDNLPQELARDDRAVSFVKGCYLGQETVARLDALGHVNRRLAQVRWHGSAVPAPGSPLLCEGKTVGQVTSAAWSVRCAAPLALAFVRRPLAQSGQPLDSPAGPAVVV